MIRPITVEGTIHFHRRGRGARKEIRTDEKAETPQCSAGRVPRISRFMALAIRFEQLIQAGEIIDYAELARLGHVTRARITQIMNLRLLAPDIQEQLLFLPLIERGRSPVYLRHLQPISAVPDWRKQRKMWQDFAR
jgi:hypothetical protein